MKQYNSYEVVFNGTNYAVSVEYNEDSVRSENYVSAAAPSYAFIAQTPAQAPWVSARRVAHLPAR